MTISNNRKFTTNLQGWTIKDCETVYSYTYTLPSCNLNTGDSITVYAGNGLNTSNSIYLWQEKCIWNNSGDKVYLYDSDGNLIDTLKQH
ncbi:MAG: lamin tail domain-containing protein [Methanohalobium sp.]|uniref:lamin tail domain-containing protein n=1 Tax=Methanohalobium sp. TaxID=2837493 RepID=UPI00397B587F